MQELFFGPVAIWFTVPAIVGTVFFSLRTLAMLVGGAETGMDLDIDVDFDVDVEVHPRLGPRPATSSDARP